jgi:hypothetical protein
VGIKNPTAAFEEGVFINSFQKYILFIYHVDQKKNRLNNIRIYEPQGEDNVPTYQAGQEMPLLLLGARGQDGRGSTARAPHRNPGPGELLLDDVLV